MDHEQFAALTRLIATKGSRRAAFLALLGATVFGQEVSREAEAKKSGGRDGGKRHGRNRGNGRHRPGRRKGRGRRQKQKQKEKATCAGLGEAPQPEKPCCQDLVLDADGRCAEPPTPSCADSCAGCCADGACLPGASNDACGTGGQPCAQCTAAETCGVCEPGVCGEPETCTPRTTCAAGACGPLSDGCGGVIQCGTCPAPQACGGGGVPSVCGAGQDCVPLTCASQGANCGPVANGCGGLLNCGLCSSGQVCWDNICRVACS